VPRCGRRGLRARRVGFVDVRADPGRSSGWPPGGRVEDSRRDEARLCRHSHDGTCASRGCGRRRRARHAGEHKGMRECRQDEKDFPERWIGRFQHALPGPTRRSASSVLARVVRQLDDHLHRYSGPTERVRRSQSLPVQEPARRLRRLRGTDLRADTRPPRRRPHEVACLDVERVGRIDRPECLYLLERVLRSAARLSREWGRQGANPGPPPHPRRDPRVALSRQSAAGRPQPGIPRRSRCRPRSDRGEEP
jgi:hypothetical protein